jgi:hypothetical protein
MNPRLMRPLARFQAPPPPFNPASIAGLQVWVDFSDASTLTLDGNGLISAVLDKSGNGFDGSQTTAGDRLATSLLNGRTCADNGTSSNNFNVTYSGSGNNWRDGYGAAVWDGADTVFPDYNSFISASSFAGGTEAGGLIHGNNGTASWYFPSLCWSNGSPGSKHWVNSTSADNSAGVAFPYIKDPFVFRGYAKDDISVLGWQIGCDRSIAGRGWHGRIGEVLLFDNVLSDANALAVRQYLADKWGAPTQT